MFLGNPFDRSLASSELFGASGVTYAIVDGYSTVEASLRGRGQLVQPGMYFKVLVFLLFNEKIQMTHIFTKKIYHFFDKS